EESIEVLNSDFNLMHLLTPLPEEIFCVQSMDYRLAKHWLNKLNNMECYSIADRQTRNAHMSYLSVCLNQKTLLGPFRQMPPCEQLAWFDFRSVDMSAADACSMSLANTSTLQALACMLQQQEQQEQQSTSRPCNTNSSRRLTFAGSNARFAGGGIGANIKQKYRTTHKLISKSRPKLVPRHLPRALASSCSETSLLAAPNPKTEEKSNRRLSCDDNSNKKNRTKLIYVLDAIKCELRGERQPNTDEYLELELKRYREFCARRRPKTNTKQMENGVAKGSDPTKERICILLSLQNDLVKLLSE
ncbi:CG32295, partial [Drosophila busckii]